MKKLSAFTLTLIFILCIFTSCTPSSQTESSKIQVVTTIFPIYDWAKNIAGENAEVIYLDESGTDMHSYQPTAADIVAIGNAEVFIHIGGISDEWVEGALKSSENNSLITLSLLEIADAAEEQTVEGMQIPEHEHKHDVKELDEHIWLSLKKAQICVSAICDALCRADKENSAVYKQNAASYNTKLGKLDKQLTNVISSAKRTQMLVADRFPFYYFASDYSLTYFAAFPGCSAESEASFETVTFLIEKTEELNLPCIFMLENSDGKLANTVASETGAEILTLNSCQSVAKKDIDNGFTYIGAMEQNIKTVTEALN